MWSGNVSCLYTAPNGYPIHVNDVEVSVLGGAFASASLVDGAVHTLGMQGAASVQLIVMVKLAVGADDLVSAPDQSDALDFLQQTITVAEGQSQSVALPFLLWPIHVDGSGEMDSARTDQFSINIAPWQTFLDHGTVTRQIDLPRITVGASADFFVLVDSATTALTGTATFCDAQATCVQNTAFQLTGPGNYQATATGLVAEGASTSAPPSSPSNPDMAQAPSAPTAPTTCGNDAQAACPTPANNGCNPGFVYTSNDNLCHVCGADGQLSCSTPANNGCNAGFVYTSNDNLCHACGADGELSCSTPSNNGCDAGFVYTSNDNLCHACGADGELSCSTPANDGCNAGLSYNSADNRCHAS
jgi:hypothetical protein